MLDFPSLPGVGCLAKNNFVNSLYTAAALPFAFTVICAVLGGARYIDRDNAWQWSIYALYL